MSTVLIDEIIEKTINLSAEERSKLIEILQEQERKNLKDSLYISDVSVKMLSKNKKTIDSNTLWIKKHYAKYAGKYVALKDGKLIAFGNTIKEADLKVKEKGVEKPLLTYLFPLGEEPFGGW